MKLRQQFEPWRQFLFSTLLLLAMGMAVTACSSEDSGEEQKTIRHLGIIMVYHPIDKKEMPNWLAKQVEEFGHVGMIACKGTWRGEPIYNIYTHFMSNLFGFFYNKEGELMPTGIDYPQEVKDWKCIYYYRIKGEL